MSQKLCSSAGGIMGIRESIRAYHGGMRPEHDRLCSWEHCYRFFRKTPLAKLANHAEQRDHAALHLGYYLASWGMLRNSFLLDYTYTIHLTAIDCLVDQRFRPLWEVDIGADKEDLKHLPTINELIAAIKQAYPSRPTTTLVTKVILGTLGCLPACDKFFLLGFKKAGYAYSDLNDRFVQRLLDFCAKHSSALHSEQVRIEKERGIRYPFMKLVDMHFWQTGRQFATRR